MTEANDQLLEEEGNLYKRVDKMSKDERSLLLYFETCAVDKSGKVSGTRMNMDDMVIAKDWNEEGLVQFGRIKHADINMNAPGQVNTHWVRLSENAWKMAHYERRRRCDRCIDKYPYRRVGVDES